MAIIGIREEPTARGTGTREIRKGLHRPAVIISGSCSNSSFVPAEILICTDTLAAEVAMRAWLEGHGIRLAS